MPLNFYTKNKQRCLKDVAVRIDFPKTSKSPVLRFTFYNECYRRIESEYDAFAIEGERIYFAPASEVTGWKLSEHRSSKTARILVSTKDEDLLKKAKSFEGSFEFKFDKDLGYWFIEKEN